MTAKRFLSFVSAKLQPLYILYNPHLLGGEAHALRDNRRCCRTRHRPSFFSPQTKNTGSASSIFFLRFPYSQGVIVRKSIQPSDNSLHILMLLLCELIATLQHKIGWYNIFENFKMSLRVNRLCGITQTVEYIESF